MYPSLYFALNDLFGVDLSFLKLINSFGFFVALAFIVGGFFLKKELVRLTANGALKPNSIQQLVGIPTTAFEITTQSLVGFIFGWKFLYLIFNAGTLFSGASLPQSHLFSTEGSTPLGIICAILLGGWAWWDGKRNTLEKPEQKTISVQPSEHVGSLLTVAAVGGILGAKLFHLIEYPEQFIAFFQAPSLNAFLGGLTIYGGLIVGGISVWLYSMKYNYNFLTIADCASPTLMIGYGIGRIGCQVSGDGDWGINNPLPQPDWLSWLPDWTWSYHFPNNVNGMGRLITDTDPWAIYPGYGTCLDIAVYPTSLYETTLAIILFSILWSLRKRFKTAGLLFASYLILNGFERFWIEKIRVNTTFDFLGITMTQAELIAVLLMLSGATLFYFLKKKDKFK